MWTREELKARAKVAFKRNYWKCVLVSLVLTLVTGGLSTSTSTSGSAAQSVTDDWDNDYDTYDDFDDYYDDEYDDYYADDYDSNLGVLETFLDQLGFSGIFGILAGGMITVFMLVIIIISAALGIFVFNPIEVGGCRFYMENTSDMPDAGRLFFSFKNGNYLNAVKIQFFRELYTFLWSLLFIVPGIIKSYEYRMVPYLLADCPEMQKEDAFRISKEMMYGQKMEAFVLDLSFIGWNILSGFTCGLVGLFYGQPYHHATNAELFLRLRENYFQRQNAQNMQGDF